MARISKKQPENTNVFISDGYIEEKAYRNSNTKILFVLKESHYFTTKGISRLEDFKVDSQVGFYHDFLCKDEAIRQFGRFDNRPKQKEKIARMAEYILHQKITSNYKTLRNALQCVAFMNINKMGGGDTTNPKELLKYYKANEIFIKQEISILNPDIIVLMINNEEIEEDLKKYWGDDKRNNLVMTMLHTAARGKNLVLKPEEIEYFNNNIAKKYDINDIDKLLNTSYQVDAENYFTKFNNDTETSYLRFSKTTLQYLIKFIYNYENGKRGE